MARPIQRFTTRAMVVVAVLGGISACDRKSEAAPKAPPRAVVTDASHDAPPKSPDPSVAAAAEGAQDKTPRPAARASAAETLGRLVVDALRMGTQDKLLVDAPGLSAEVAAEMAKTRDVIGRDFAELLEDIDAKGIDRSRIEFVRVGDVQEDDWSPIGSATIHFRSGEVPYHVTTTWIRSSGGVSSLGMSAWFRKTDTE